MPDMAQYFVDPAASLREVMAHLDGLGKGIVLLADYRGRLLATITDGDIRRAILAGMSLEVTVSQLVAERFRSGDHGPVTALQGTPRDDLIQLMQARRIRQLPLVDADERVVGLVTFDQLVPDPLLPVQAVIMAGGFGVRLRPLTDELPKPMLPIDGIPLLELTVQRLRQAGIRRIHITTHYLHEKIVRHFGNGRRFGVQLNYVPEDRPLGTAGSLGLVGTCDEPLLVLNGDILTRVDYRAMLAFHHAQDAELTVGVRQYDVEVPYGVVQSKDGRILRLEEKPKIGILVNAGVYLLEPSVRELITRGERCDMTELITILLDHERNVASFPIVEYWLDIGQHEDLDRAQHDMRAMRWAAHDSADPADRPQFLKVPA
jgi:dTDP-glucose pyrophosphorylase